MRSLARLLGSPHCPAAVPILLMGAILLVHFAPAQPAQGETIGDRLWIWGHPAGVYNESYLAPLAKKSTMEPVAAADWMGVRNMIFVRYNNLPKPPLDDYYRPFEKLDRVYWSLVAAGGATSQAERDEVYRLAGQQANLAGFILDDFFHGHVSDPLDLRDPPADAAPFDASLTPEQLHMIRQRTVRGKRLPLMAVVYTGQISPRARRHLDEVDQVCLWTWRPADLEFLESNLAALERLIPGKSIFLGCYMFDFHARRPLPVPLMRRQTELAYRWVRQGRVEGIIFLATPNVDVGLEAVQWTRDWIARTADEPIQRMENVQPLP